MLSQGTRLGDRSHIVHCSPLLLKKATKKLHNGVGWQEKNWITKIPFSTPFDLVCLDAGVCVEEVCHGKEKEGVGESTVMWNCPSGFEIKREEERRVHTHHAGRVGCLFTVQATHRSPSLTLRHSASPWSQAPSSASQGKGRSKKPPIALSHFLSPIWVREWGNHAMLLLWHRGKQRVY